MILGPCLRPLLTLLTPSHLDNYPANVPSESPERLLSTHEEAFKNTFIKYLSTSKGDGEIYKSCNLFGKHDNFAG